MSRTRTIRLDSLEQFLAINVLSDPGAIGGPVVIPQCAAIILTWGLEDGKIGKNVLHGSYSGGFAGTVAQANAMFTALTTGAAWTALAAFLGTTTSLGQLQIRDLNTANQPIIGSSLGGAPGTSASASLPNEVAACLTFRTAFTGPANRGRLYVPGFATNALGAGNVIAGGTVTALNNWANTIPTALSGSGYTFAIGQRARQAYTGSTGTSHPARAAKTVAITSQSCRDNHWDTIRRRGLK